MNGNACNSGVCSPACSETNHCKGGCCDLDGGTCQPGNADRACATMGSTCTDCTSGCMYGPRCLNDFGVNYCGCMTGTDCLNDTSCTNKNCGGGLIPGTMVCGGT
jgi:hypothetical protein